MNIARKLAAASGIGATLALSAFAALPAAAQSDRTVVVHHYPRHHTTVRRVVVHNRWGHHPTTFGDLLGRSRVRHRSVTRVVVHHPMHHSTVTKTVTHHPMHGSTVVKKTVVHHP